MPKPPENNAERSARPAGTQMGANWDTSRARSSHCTLASASAAGQQVVLNFGVTRSREGAPKELELQLMHRIALSPKIASQVRQLLSRLIAEHDAR
jgi:hypothetical protein